MERILRKGVRFAWGVPVVSGDALSSVRCGSLSCTECVGPFFPVSYLVTSKLRQNFWIFWRHSAKVWKASSVFYYYIKSGPISRLFRCEIQNQCFLFVFSSLFSSENISKNAALVITLFLSHAACSTDQLQMLTNVRVQSKQSSIIHALFASHNLQVCQWIRSLW
jgi:hypothetical protein